MDLIKDGHNVALIIAGLLALNVYLVRSSVQVKGGKVLMLPEQVLVAASVISVFAVFVVFFIGTEKTPWDVVINIAAFLAASLAWYCVLSGTQEGKADQIKARLEELRDERERAFIEELLNEDLSDIEVEDF